MPDSMSEGESVKLCRRLAFLAVIAGLCLAAPAAAVEPLRLATYADRDRAQAWLDAFEADLVRRDSATASLQAWCDALPAPPGTRIRAERVTGQDKAPDAGVRAYLAAGPDTEIRYRRVRLSCGNYVLSEADNWYRPDRLTAAMNRTLETSQTPFGVAVADLGFRRQTLSARVLFNPGTRVAGEAESVVVPRHVISNIAVLLDGGYRPFSLVIETYTANVLTPVLPQGSTRERASR